MKIRGKLRPIVALSLVLGLCGFSLPSLAQSDPEEIELLRLGNFQTAGSHCYNWDESPLVVTPFRVYLPFRNWLRRGSGTQRLQGLCEFSMEVQVPAGKRLILYGIFGRNTVNLPVKSVATSRFLIEISTEAQLLADTSLEAVASPRQDVLIFDAEEEIAGNCGQNLTLRGRTETELFGGEGSASSSLTSLSFDYALIDCDL